MAAPRYDIAIIGADAEGYAAAACAAVCRKSVVLVKTGMERPAGFAPGQIPNDIWRLLNLQSLGYQARGPSQIFVAMNGGGPKPVHAYDRANETLLDAEEHGAGALWRDFLMRLSDGAGGDGLGPLPTDSANDLLDDYFADETLKARIASLALISHGLAGDEPGSAFVLRSVDPAYWPAEAQENAPSLTEAVASLCEKQGVVRVEGAVRSVQKDNGRGRLIELETGEQIRAQTVMASSVSQALGCNLGIEGPCAPIMRRFGAEGYIRIILDGPQDDAEAADGYYVINTGRDALRDARSAFREGRSPSLHPLILEKRDRVVLARAPYCPYRLFDDNDAREWTGQDRQALGRQVCESIKTSLGVKRPARSIEVRVDTYEHDAPPLARVHAPDPLLPSIEGAARCALALIANG